MVFHVSFNGHDTELANGGVYWINGSSFMYASQWYVWVSKILLFKAIINNVTCIICCFACHSKHCLVTAVVRSVLFCML